MVLLLGTIGGLSLASVAGARRTESSFPTYVASTNPSTVELFSRYTDPALGIKSGYDASQAALIEHLPLVKRAATAIIFDGNIDLNSVTGAVRTRLTAGEAPPTFIGSLDGEFTRMDRVTLVAGRFANPKSPDEAIMNAEAARQGGLRVGSVIHIPFYTDAEILSPKSFRPFLIAKVKLVGVFTASGLIVQSDKSKLGSSEVIFSTALTKKLAPQCATGTESFLQLAGGASNAKRVLGEAYKVDPVATQFPAQVTTSFLPSVQQTILPEATALGAFGAIAGLSTLLIAGLMMGRLIRDGADETSTLRALGATRATMLGDEALGALGALFIGAVLAVVVAIALSPLAPLGPVRPVYPSAGVDVDWTVLGCGFIALIVLLGTFALVHAWREFRRVTSRSLLDDLRPEPRWLRTVGRSGLPIAAVTGLRFALDPGRGRSATPVRSAMFGAVLAVTVLVTTVTFGASLDSLVSHPALYGWNWNYAILSSFAGAEDLPAPQTAALLNRDPYLQSWSGVNVARAKLDGQINQIFAEKPGALVGPPLLSGHGLMADDEIVVGPQTLSQLHKRVGDTVTLNDGFNKSRKLVIVGTATMPAFTGQGMGSGAIASTSDFPAALLNLQGSSIPGPNVVLVRARPGVNLAAARRSLVAINAAINKIPAASDSAGGVISVLRPAEIVNFRSMGTTPAILAGGLVVGAVVALGISLAASVRRRRRVLALLKALGFTQRQLAASIAWQASVAAFIGCVVGVPLGVALGRQLWLLFARSIFAVPRPAVPIWSLVLVGIGALAFANLVAALPGRSAARTPTGLVLRAE
ncbi:MAG TPA: ABC transporter permease [Acidimicrobiales bacterium]|nr:ABC transporter permease [Acidimicrobiales bacterium]